MNYELHRNTSNSPQSLYRWFHIIYLIDMNLEDLGSWGFLAIMGLAVLGGFIQWEWTMPLVATLGLIVGFTNISKSEIVPFLVATLAIAGASAIIANLPSVGVMLNIIFRNLAVAAGAIAIIPALKVIYETGKN